MKTTVVNIHKTDQYDVYIGRAGHGQDGYYGNPFSQCSREKNIADFQSYFYKRLKTDIIYKQNVLSLKGKTLGCFCAPKKCHGHIIADYLNGLDFKTFGIVGSRNFDNYAFLKEMLSWYDIKKIISGGAKGADSLAKKYATEYNIPVVEFLPDWDRFGKSAGYKRNTQIVEASEALIAFWDGVSKGTKHSIDLADTKGIPIYIFWPTIDDEIDNWGF